MQQSTYMFKVVGFRHHTGYTISICKNAYVYKCIHVYKNIPNIHSYTYKIHMYTFTYIYLCLYMYISSNMHSIYVYYYACVGIKYEYYI